MNGSIRVSAKTLDDAITEALIQLGVTSDRLEYEVIEKGSAGFLGIGMKQAVIEARRKPEPVVEEPKAEVKEEKPEVKKEPAREFKKKEHYKKEVKQEAKNEFKREFKSEVKNEVKKDTAKTEAQPAIRHAEVKEETKNAVEAFLRDTLNAMGMTVELISDVDADGALGVEMKGENMGLLIGKRGQTLDALQYLANRVANKHQDGYVRVKLDTENYRARREETLKNLAKNIAYKVKRSKRPVSLEPMNPYERRIIHAALQSDPYVTTHSEGEEPYRKVVVTLKR